MLTPSHKGGYLEGEGEYSPIEHLAKTVALSSFDWKEVYFGMLTACFDASGKEADQKYLVVAGFVSVANDWTDFDKLWRARLAIEGKTYFHRSEYGAVVKKGTEREKFFLDLIEIARSHAYRKVGCIVPIELFRKMVSVELREYFFLHSYVMASLVAMSQVMKWRQNESGFRDTPIRWIFERGDDGDTLLMKYMRSAGMRDPDFEFGKDATLPSGEEVKAFTPLQAADFLAYELFQVGQHYDNNCTRRPDYNYSFIDAFNEKIGEPCLLAEADLRKYEDLFKTVQNLERSER